MKSKNSVFEPSVGIVIPAYNEEKTIATVLESIFSQTRLPDQIIVVDDCSEDMTGKIAKSYKGVEVIRPEVNQGTKAQAQNIALPYVKTEIVITIDGDTILALNAIEEILNAFKGEKPAVAACGFIVPKKIRTVWEKGRFIEYLFGITLYKNIQKEYNAIMVCSGCFSAFNTKKLIDHGGFQKRTMAEDMDLTWGYLARKEKVAYVPNAICYPIEPETFPIFKAQIRRWYRSFFQNIAIHKRNIFTFKNPVLSLIILTGLLDGTIFPLMFGTSIYFSIHSKSFMVKLICIWILFDLIVVLIPILIKGYKIKKLKVAVLSIPFFLFVTRWVNSFFFFESFIKEWILKKRLSVWEKGH